MGTQMSVSDSSLSAPLKRASYRSKSYGAACLKPDPGSHSRVIKKTRPGWISSGSIAARNIPCLGSEGLHHRQRQRRAVPQNRVPARTLVHFALRRRRGAKTVAMVSGRWAADGLGSGTLAIPFRKARSSSSGKMPRGRCLQADPRMRQEHLERRTIPSQNGHN